MRSEITFPQLKKFFEHILGIKLKKDLHTDWMCVSIGKRNIWRCHATLVDTNGRIIDVLEANCTSLPKKLTQTELKEFYVEQWRKKEINYQHLYLSGHEVEDTLQNKTELMQIMNQKIFNWLIEGLKIKDNCKKLKEYDRLSEAELKIKLVVAGIL